jgi:mannosyltransferase OCH1-like enzyme
MIPKIIWQTHNYKYEDLPDYLKKISKNWQNVNPGWEYRYVDHIEREKFVKENIPEMYNLYLKIKPFSQSDIWRSSVLYKFGGVYADMDSFCVKPIDYMLQNYNNEDLIITPRNKKGLINCANFAAAKESKTLKKIIEDIKNSEPTDIDWHGHSCFVRNAGDPGTDYFTAAIHAFELKDAFYEFDIDYYGKNMTYREYLANILKLNDKDFLESIA